MAKPLRPLFHKVFQPAVVPGFGPTLSTGAMPPAGYSRTTVNGNPATYFGRPVYDNFKSGGSSMIYL